MVVDFLLQFPAQNARASLKLPQPVQLGIGPRKFPAQNARASLKPEYLLQDEADRLAISRAKRASLIEALLWIGGNLTAQRISRAKRAGLIEAIEDRQVFCVQFEFPAQNARASLKRRRLIR